MRQVWGSCVGWRVIRQFKAGAEGAGALSPTLAQKLRALVAEMARNGDVLCVTETSARSGAMSATAVSLFRRYTGAMVEVGHFLRQRGVAAPTYCCRKINVPPVHGIFGRLGAERALVHEMHGHRTYCQVSAVQVSSHIQC